MGIMGWKKKKHYLCCYDFFCGGGNASIDLIPTEGKSKFARSIPKNQFLNEIYGSRNKSYFSLITSKVQWHSGCVRHITLGSFLFEKGRHRFGFSCCVVS